MVSNLLTPDGIMIIDDCPAEHWPELTSGNWQNGLSPDGAMQIVWDPSDAVFAIRYDDAVNPEMDYLTESDRLPIPFRPTDPSDDFVQRPGIAGRF